LVDEKHKTPITEDLVLIKEEYEKLKLGKTDPEKSLKRIVMISRYLIRQSVHRKVQDLLKKDIDLLLIYDYIESLLKDIQVHVKKHGIKNQFLEKEISYILLEIHHNKKILKLLFDEEHLLHKHKHSLDKDVVNYLIRQIESLNVKITHENDIMFQILDDYQRIDKGPDKKKIIEKLHNLHNEFNHMLKEFEKEFLFDKKHLSDLIKNKSVSKKIVDPILAEIDSLYGYFKKINKNRNDWFASTAVS
jgi:hypothetical protein